MQQTTDKSCCSCHGWVQHTGGLGDASAAGEGVAAAAAGLGEASAAGEGDASA